MYSQQVVTITLSASFITALMLAFKPAFSQLLGLPGKYYLYAVLISYFSLFYNLVIALLYAMEQAVKISITSIVVGAGTIVMQLVLVFTMEDKAMALIFAMFFAAIVTFILFIVYSAPYFTWPRFSKSELIKYYKYSISQLPSDVSVWFVAASDRLLLNKIQGASAAGVYGMGNTLGQIPSMLFQSVNKAYVPYVFRHFKESEEGREDALNEVANTAVMVESILTAVVVSLIILSNNIVSLLESRYIDSAIIMPLVLFAVWVDCNRIIFMNPLAYNIKYIKVKSLIWVFAAVLDVGLNLCLIPKYSVYGACASLIISYGVSCLLILHYSKKAMKIRYDGRRLTAVLVVSIIFSMSYFMGSNVKSLLLKLPIIIIYLSIVVYINNMQTIIIRYINHYVKVFFNKQR
jgi:O-antigen/teichoic acid export membrane protein